MFKQQYDDYLRQVEHYLDNLEFSDALLGVSMKYSLLGGGKRVRPVLALACAQIVGGKPEGFVREACAIELIHTYSLIHDDLPAMDDDDYRRGKLSNHKKFGEAAAILAGDALLTCAFELLAQPLPIPAERQLRVIRETAHAAGWNGMVGGQALDTLNESGRNTLNEVESIHHKKTGALLVASARLGAILGGGSEEEIAKLAEYASHLGLAFQVKDDILDIIGQSDVLGKPVGSDQKHNKSTYPAFLGIDGAVNHLHNIIRNAKDALTVFGERKEFLFNLADYVEQRDH